MKLSRRNLLQGSAAATLGHSPLARALSLFAASAPTGQPGLKPREHYLLDKGWRFTLGNAADPAKDLGFDGPDDFSKQKTKFKFAAPKFDDTKWRPLDLPHDWAIELDPVHANREKDHGFRPLGREYPATSIGWYRRTFTLPEGTQGKRVVVEFDGVYRDSQVFLNGFYIGRHESGYAPSSYDLTDFLDYTGPNALTVRVDATHGDGWFYEGAGIYRHVWLTITDPVHLQPFETIVRTQPTLAKDGSATVSLSSLVGNRSLKPSRGAVTWQLYDPAGALVATASSPEADLPPDVSTPFTATVALQRPVLWSPETPVVYNVVVTLDLHGKAADRDATVFGVRTVEFSADHGMTLNGKPIKLKGVCNHQDHACVGTALPDRVNEWRVERLVEMGCNALRTSHNCPTPELIDACDRLGVMVMCETRTFSSTDSGQAELATMVKRYRNHPSIVIWSLGNEEPTQGDANGEAIAARNQQLTHELDPTRKCTVAMNSGWGKGISNVIDVMGFNYKLGEIEKYHQDHPHQPLIGTETASLVSTRGIYVNDKAHNWVSAYDSHDKEKATSWAHSAQDWWKMYATHDYLPGGFAWTGFDYRGEPTPYGWPSTSSQFGIMDLCGFPKDEFFYYQAWWTSKPVLHVLPHWNWQPGDMVKVWVYSNLKSVELFVNGQSLGSKNVERLGHVEWLNVPYAPGTLEVRGSDGKAVVLTEKRETTGLPSALRLTADRTTIKADGEDVSMLKLEVLDSAGRVVPTANVKVKFTLTGAGKLLGLGNGDPNSLELDGSGERTTFNGLAQAIVQGTTKSGTLTLTATTDGLTPATLTLTAASATPRASLT